MSEKINTETLVENPIDQNDQYNQIEQEGAQYVENNQQAVQYDRNGQEVQYYQDDQQVVHYDRNNQIDGHQQNGHFASNEDPCYCQPTSKNSKQESRISGKVKWFNAKYGYGFITRDDTNEDVFVHFSGISRMNPRHAMKSLGDGERVEFNIMASSVTGPNYRPVRGNPYVSYAPRSYDPPRHRDYGAAGDHKNAYLARTTDASGNTSSTEYFTPQYSRRGHDSRPPHRGRYAYRTNYRNNRIPRFQQRQEPQPHYEPAQYQHHNY